MMSLEDRMFHNEEIDQWQSVMVENVSEDLKRLATLLTPVPGGMETMVRVLKECNCPQGQLAGVQLLAQQIRCNLAVTGLFLQYQADNQPF